MREMLAKIWGVEEGKSPFMPTEQKKTVRTPKTETGEKATKVEVNPELQQMKLNSSHTRQVRNEKSK